MNLLTSPLIDAAPLGRLSLPGLLAAMARGEVAAFPALRPHQRAACHSFLTLLGALALDHRGRRDLPRDEGEWRDLLSALTGGEAPWALFAPDDQPAFMQPAAPKGTKWVPVATPDALDVLITARNHDLKQQIARHNDPQDWIFALITLQTSEGFSGRGNYGIARMNGGSSSRAMLAFIPDPGRRGAIDPSLWWQRDVAALLARRDAGREIALGPPGGPALMWALPWPEGAQLDLTKMDPWFIEVCRRIRLVQGDNGISALRANSSAARTDGKAFSGVTGDPWAPITTSEPRKSLTIGEGEFTYKRLNDLLFSGAWQRPALAEPLDSEGDGLLLAEALGRGNSKTDGMKSRLIVVPGKVRGILFSKTMGDLAEAQIAEIKVFDDALKFGLATAAADGDGAPDKADYARSNPARDAFDARADALFFPALFARAAAADLDAREAAQVRFLNDLLALAEAEFAAALPAIPVSSLRRPRAEVRARRAFSAPLWRADFAPLIGYVRRDADEH